MDTKIKLIEFIKTESYELGFDLFGITNALPHSDIKFYKDWLSKGYNSRMFYLKKHSFLKENPNNLLNGAKSILCFGASYNTNYPYSLLDKEYKPRISRFALNFDYHYVLKNKLTNLIQSIFKNFDINFNYRICVDSAPLLERSYAVSSGLGWIGKNGCLINKKVGSFFFLSEIIIDIELDENTEIIEDNCGNCRLCIDNCPTNAIKENRFIDASRCLSYLTIEYKGEIPFYYRNNGFIFGCDICQEVCLWNKNSTLTRIEEFKPRNEIIELSWEQCKSLTIEEYRNIFRKSSVKRCKYPNLIRNINLSIKDNSL